METKVFVPDITCDSCVRLITKRLSGTQGIQSMNVLDDAVVLNHEEQVPPDTYVDGIRRLGFRASLDPFAEKTWSERMKDMRENRKKYRVESRMAKNAALAFIILAILEGIATVGIFHNITGFFPKYGIWFLYLNITVVALGFAVQHVLSYKTTTTHMVGMMIGMTFGMQAGLMLGAVIGATNGFFIGAMGGMLAGVIVGALMGKCCGVMGVMEGMMAGLMGGTMGPMISVMMFNDHLAWFMPFYMVVNLLIIAGLSYMVIQTNAERKDVKKVLPDSTVFITACIIITAIFIAIMAYGPKSVLLGG